MGTTGVAWKDLLLLWGHLALPIPVLLLAAQCKHGGVQEPP